MRAYSHWRQLVAPFWLVGLAVAAGLLRIRPGLPLLRRCRASPPRLLGDEKLDSPADPT